MRRIIYLLFLLAPVSSLFAQGKLNWQNKFSAWGNRAPVYGPEPNNPFAPLLGNDATGLPAGTQTYGGPLLAGTGYTLAIFTRVGDTFVEIDRTTFRTGTGAGYCNQRLATDPNHPGGSYVTAVLRAWDNQGGTITTWDQALAGPATALGESLPFTVGPLSTFLDTPPYTTNISSFNLYYLGGAYIRTQPQDVVVPAAGASAQMHVDVVSGVGPPSFQWQRDGVDIPGATNATLVFTNVQYADAGGYRVVVSVPSLTLTSRVARLSLPMGQLIFANEAPGLRAPIFGPNPNNPFESLQGNPVFGIPAGTQTYSGAPLSGSGYTSALFVRTVGEEFREVDRTVFRTGTPTGEWSLREAVSDPLHPPGATVECVVRVWDNQGGTLTNWDEALASSTPIGESATFIIPHLGGSIGGTDYDMAYTDGLRSFNIFLRQGAFISSQPDDVIVPAGSNAGMRVEVASTVGPPAFQWRRDGADVPGATDATLSFTNVQYADAGGYSATITIPSLTLTSRVARLSVQPRIAGIEHSYIPEWGADAVRLSYDSTPLRPVRIEVRSSILDAWINMGQYVNPNVRSYFFDIGPTNDMRFYRLSIDP